MGLNGRLPLVALIVVSRDMTQVHPSDSDAVEFHPAIKHGGAR